MKNQITQSVELKNSTAEVRMFDGLYYLNDLHQAFCKEAEVSPRFWTPKMWHSINVDAAGANKISLMIVVSSDTKPEGVYTNLLGLTAYAKYLSNDYTVTGTDFKPNDLKLIPYYDDHTDYSLADAQLDHALNMARQGFKFKSKIIDMIYDHVGVSELWDVIGSENEKLVALLMSWAARQVRHRKSVAYIKRCLPNASNLMKECYFV